MYQLSYFLQAIDAYMPHQLQPHSLSNTTTGQTKGESKPIEKQLSMQSVGKIDISDLYEGVRLADPITLENVQDLVESYKRGQHLHETYVIQIVKAVTDLFQAMPNIKQVNIDPAPHITVVGDLHGQLDDLLLIFRENGLPSEKNPYVFNGDFVDRGTHSVEIAVLVYAFQLLYPHSVHINRGNHEDRAITTVFGFMKVSLLKKGSMIINICRNVNKSTTRLCMICFWKVFGGYRYVQLSSSMCIVSNKNQIGTVIDKRILVLHAGLSRSEMTVKEMALLPRWDYVLARTKTSASS